MPAHPIGVILLARLAVDRSLQGQGYGRALMADAAIRTLQAADLVGARALLVHARDERAAAFYERLGSRGHRPTYSTSWSWSRTSGAHSADLHMLSARCGSAVVISESSRDRSKAWRCGGLDFDPGGGRSLVR